MKNKVYKVKVNGRFLKGVEFEFSYSGFREAMEFAYNYKMNLIENRRIDDKMYKVLVCLR